MKCIGEGCQGWPQPVALQLPLVPFLRHDTLGNSTVPRGVCCDGELLITCATLQNTNL